MANIVVRPRDEELHKKWKAKNKSVTPTDNSHFVFSTKEEEDLFYSYQFDTDAKKKNIKNIEKLGGKEPPSMNMVMHPLH